MANTKMTPFRLDEETLARLDAIGRHLDSKWPDTRNASRAEAVKFAIMSTFLRLEHEREHGKYRKAPAARVRKISEIIDEDLRK